MTRLIGFFTAAAITACLVVVGSAGCGSDDVGGGLSALGTGSDKRQLAAASQKQASGEQSVAGDFYEVLLKWGASGTDPRVRGWLERQGLTAMSMKAGMLTLASPGQIEKCFGVSVERAQPPFELPVPEELRSSVSSITVLKPRSYH